MKLKKLEDMEKNEMKNNAEGEEPTVGEKIQAILKSQGIESELDEDGDVCFEYHFKDFLLEESKGTDFFILTTSFKVEMDERDKMRFLKVANQMHISYRMARMTCVDGGIKFSVETILNPEMDLKPLLSFSLYLLDVVVEESSKLYKELGEKEESLPDSIIGFHEAQEQTMSDNKEGETKEEEPAEKEASDSRTPSIGFNSSRYRV